MKKGLLCLANILLLVVTLNAQISKEEIFKKMEGYWQGAFIKNNSFQKIDLRFYKEKEQINSLQIVKEWHPQFGEFVLPVTIDSLNKIIFNTGYGKAIMEFDRNSLEMIGQIENSLPTIYLHLKKAPIPPKSQYNVEEVRIKNKEVTLFGHLHQPKRQSKTAIIIIGGRGCYAGDTKHNLYAKFFREYGLSVLVYNKRGTGESSGDCATATIADLASDLATCRNYLAQLPNQFTTIGVLGSSAGGWVMTKAEEAVDFDFMISVVGPSTSVKDQQLQSMEYGFDLFKLSSSARSNLMDYTKMMFEAEASAASFEKFEALLELSKQEGWYELLENTDIPSSVDGINDLWVRRHNYDPKTPLSTFNKPFLAVYGEADWIVPYKENISRLKELFSGDRKELLNIITAHESGHSTEAEGKYITLENDKSYWRFFRIAPSVKVGIVDFLIKYNLIEGDN